MKLERAYNMYQETYRDLKHLCGFGNSGSSEWPEQSVRVGCVSGDEVKQVGRSWVPRTLDSILMVAIKGFFNVCALLR